VLQLNQIHVTTTIERPHYRERITVLYTLLRPLLFRLDAERTHDLITGLLRAVAGTPVLPVLRALYSYDDPILRFACAGLEFQNPLGLAAGFD
jgi:hypothetical protein